jgi:predicted SnoaL-like aldol condensation-catalyzing enzyme
VRAFVDDILVTGRTEKLAGYFNGDKHIEHNPQIADNLSGLDSALRSMAAQGIRMKYERVHKVLGEGNFVLVVSEGACGGKQTSFYDLLRVESGKIAEHWDAIETIPPHEQWKNANGKFGFHEESSEGREKNRLGVCLRNSSPRGMARLHQVVREISPRTRTNNSAVLVTKKTPSGRLLVQLAEF